MDRFWEARLRIANLSRHLKPNHRAKTQKRHNPEGVRLYIILSLQFYLVVGAEFVQDPTISSWM